MNSWWVCVRFVVECVIQGADFDDGFDGDFIAKIIDIQKKTILVVGGSGVGKTSFINKVSNKPFDRIYNPTIGTNKSFTINI